MITLEHISREYINGGCGIKALDDVSLTFEKGDFAVIHGPSGCGKTTLLMIISGMLGPTAGRISLNGVDITKKNNFAKAKIRAENIGFVFQSFHLVPYLSVMDNVMLADVRFIGHNGNRAKAVLEKVGLSERLKHLPSQLSAGEKQRTALARAMLNEPPILLADEPTGNLDEENEKMVFEYLLDYNKKGGTVITVTHSKAIADIAGRRIAMKAGKIVA